MYTNLWACIQEMKAEQDNAAAEQVVDANAFLLESMPAVEAGIDDHCEQAFAPYMQTRSFDVEPNTLDVRTNRINLRLPYLSVSEVLVDGVDLTAWDGQAGTRDEAEFHPYPRRETPFYDLQGMVSGIWVPNDETHFTEGIEVTGITGYRRNYANEGWQDSGDTVQNDPLLIGGTLLIVTNAAEGQFISGAPRFSEGDLLRLSGTEFVRVWKIEENVLSVERGVRGSTKVQHAKNASIEVWQVEPEIKSAATRWVVYKAKRRASYESAKLDAGAAGTVTISNPTRMPDDTRDVLERYKNRSNQYRAV